MRQNMIDAAREYAQRGWAVFPLRARRKEPILAGGFKQATTDVATITRWWRQWPNANIGIATGRVSAILVVDVDPRAGGDEELERLEAKYGTLPTTIESLTGGGGRHLFFRCTTDVRSGRLAPGVDLKANGGYIVAPPSIHPSGRAYSWEVSHHPREVQIADPPAWILALARDHVLQPRITTPDHKIPEGERNTTLTSLAGAMRRRGATQKAIENALLAVNDERCDPPLPKKEVLSIASSIARYTPEVAQKTDPELSRDFGHATVLSQLFRNRYRWAPHRGSWMRWSNGVWRPTPDEAVAKDAADELRRHYASQLALAEGKENIRALTKKITETYIYARITGALTFLKGFPGVLTEPGEWDKNPWLLNVRNGTFDFQSGMLRPHNPDDLLTRQATVDYDPEATGWAWDAHIVRFLPNVNIRRQVQRDLGMALVGAVLEETLPVWYGTGANGKTTTARVIMQVLGDYADRAAPNLLIAGKFERHPTEIADLYGRRLVFSVETDQGAQLAEALVKEMTGGDRKKGRYMRQDFFSFDQTFSIFLIVNYKPIVRGTDPGIWRRIRLIPWEYQIPENERRPMDIVVAELVAEAPAILNWLISGFLDWAHQRTWLASEVQAASDAYRQEMDVLGEFLNDRCELGPRFTIAKGELYKHYQAWAKEANEHPVSHRTFTRLLAARGIGEARTERARQYVGIRIKPEFVFANEVF